MSTEAPYEAYHFGDHLFTTNKQFVVTAPVKVTVKIGTIRRPLLIVGPLALKVVKCHPCALLDCGKELTSEGRYQGQ